MPKMENMGFLVGSFSQETIQDMETLMLLQNVARMIVHYSSTLLRLAALTM